jgi:hypothetical protein
MKPFSERADMHNNNIKENIIIKEEDKSNFENTNKALLNVQADLLLNKKVVKVSNSLTKNNSVQLKNNIIVNDDTFNINKDEWIRNRLKIDTNMQERKIIYSLETENDNNSSHSIDVLSAYKDNGFYVIFKYINEKNNYDKEIKAKIKWNMFSNHFKIFDRNENIIEEIIYNFNFKGWNGPTKLQVLLPISKQNIINGIGINNSKLYMHKMENKSPEYNSIYKCYVLNFIKRKVIPNEKNMQIVYSDLKEDKSNILLQFAQTEKNEYILDYKYPFNNITALALAMTNLSSRMFCQ